MADGLGVTGQPLGFGGGRWSGSAGLEAGQGLLCTAEALGEPGLLGVGRGSPPASRGSTRQMLGLGSRGGDGGT